MTSKNQEIIIIGLKRELNDSTFFPFAQLVIVLRCQEHCKICQLCQLIVYTNSRSHFIDMRE